MHNQMIGISTNIRNSRRVLYPSMSICTELWKDFIFTSEKSEDPLDANFLENLYTSPIHKILQRIVYYKRANVTR